MKLTLSLVVLSVLALSEASLLRGSTTRANLNQGYIQYGDRLLYSTYLQKYAMQNAIQTQDMIYRGNYTNRITGIRATEVGYTQYANAWVLSGGVGYNHTTIRFQTARGWGFYYYVEIWGR